MSEYESSTERPRKYPLLFHLERYRDDLNNADSFADLRGACEDFILGELDPRDLNTKDVDLLFLQLEEQGLIPDHEQMEYSNQLSYERFAMVPFTVVAPYIEFRYDVDEIIKWYQGALELVKSACERHTPKKCCVNTNYPWDVAIACDESILCPLRVACQILAVSSFDYDFNHRPQLLSDGEYAELVERKLDLAGEQGLIHPRTLESTKAEWARKYKDYKNPTE